MRHKIKTREEIKAIAEKVKSDGKKVVFTNGCFDLIHVGHVRYLQEAKRHGDIFIVAINSDSSVKALKGNERPIVPEQQRAEVVAAFECVDFVTIFTEPDPLKLITYLKPDALVKGGDWAEDSIIGKDVIESEGGSVIRVPVIEGAATTNIVQTIVKRYSLKDAGRISRDVEEKASMVKLLILDVDGVLTDGRIVFTDGGEEIKAFDVKDGHGIKLLMRAGVEVAVLTGRESKVVAHRARDLGIAMVYQGAKEKLPVFEMIMKERNLSSSEICYVGDDVVDIPVMKKVGLAIAVADSLADVRETADHITERPGGRGAVREVCELIMKAQGKWNALTLRYRQ